MDADYNRTFRHMTSPFVPTELQYSFEQRYPTPDPKARFAFSLSRPKANIQTFQLSYQLLPVFDITMDLSRKRIPITGMHYHDLPQEILESLAEVLPKIITFFADQLAEFHKCLLAVCGSGWNTWLNSANGNTLVAMTCSPVLSRHLARNTDKTRNALYRTFISPPKNPVELIRNADEQLVCKIYRTDLKGYSRQVSVTVEDRAYELWIPDRCDNSPPILDVPENTNKMLDDLVRLLTVVEAEKSWDILVFLESWLLMPDFRVEASGVARDTMGLVATIQKRSRYGVTAQRNIPVHSRAR